ncbi:MAG: DUF6493 family protein [Janthinobacterium lividum]
MPTTIEEFENLIRHQDAQELIPFLLALPKPDFPAARAVLKRLEQELQSVVQLSENSWGTRATSAQSQNLFLASLVVLTRQDILRGGLRGAWIIGAHATDTARQFKTHFLTLMKALQPAWLGEWLLGLQARAAGWAPDYALLRALEQAQLLAYSPPLIVRALPSALHQWGWELSLAPTMPANATETIADQLRADQTLLARDLPLIFDFDSPISSIQVRVQPPLPPRQETTKWAVGAEYPWQVWDRTHPPQLVSWSGILLSLVASGHLDRADILTRCLLALRRDFRRPLLTWFRALFLALKPTFTEHLARQQELTELLAHPQALVVNFALEQLKDLLPEPGFDLAPLLLVAESLLARPDLKTGLRTLVAGLAKLPGHTAAHAPAVASLLAAALAHPDAAVQARAAQGLAGLLTAKKPLLAPAETAAVLATLAPQAELLGPPARATLAPWLAAYPEPAPATATYAPLAQFVPDLSPATAIAPVADWHELLFLTGQVLRHDAPAALERWLDGLLRLHGHLPAGYAAQLQPYLVQILPQLKKASAAEAAALLAGPLGLYGHEGLVQALLLGWAGGFATPRVASVQLARSPATTTPLLALEQQRFLLAEARLRTATALPLLSTPTHQPHWVAPGALVSKLLAYQAAGVAPATADLAVALARAAHAHPAEASQALDLLPQLADAGLRELLTWFFGPPQALPPLAPANGRPPAQLATAVADALPELWAVAARTKAPAGTFPTLAASLGYDYPGTTQPLPATCAAVPHENRYPNPSQPTQEAVYRFVELAWSSGATTPAPSPLLLYAPPVGQSQHGSWESNWQLVGELPYFTALVPNYPAPLFAHVLRCAAWADNLESSERDLLLLALHALLGPGPVLAAAATAVLASGLIHHSPPGRSLAQEVLLQAIAHGRLRPEALGLILGQQLATGYAPAARLADNLLPIKGIDGLTDDALRQIFDALLPALPAAPPRNTGKLLDAYAALLGRTRQPVPAPVQARLREWQAPASLRKSATTLLAI